MSELYPTMDMRCNTKCMCSLTFARGKCHLINGDWNWWLKVLILSLLCWSADGLGVGHKCMTTSNRVAPGAVDS